MNDHLATTEEFSNTVRGVMKELQKEALATPNDEWVYFEYQNAEGLPSVEDQRRAIRYLAKEKAIKVSRDKYPLGAMATSAQMMNLKTRGSYLEVLQPAFNDLAQKLSGKSAVQPKLSFDPSTSILGFANHSIEISKNKNTDAHYLLAILSKDLAKDWACDEVWENDFFRSGNREYSPTEDWKKIYNAGASVNSRIEKATSIKDFLRVTKTSVSINKKYLN
jgi:hypothetical protein